MTMPLQRVDELKQIRLCDKRGWWENSKQVEFSARTSLSTM